MQQFWGGHCNFEVVADVACDVAGRTHDATLCPKTVTVTSLELLYPTLEMIPRNHRDVASLTDRKRFPMYNTHFNPIDRQAFIDFLHSTI